MSKVKTLMIRAFNGFDIEGWTLQPTDDGVGLWCLRPKDAEPGSAANTLFLRSADLTAINAITGAALRRMKKEAKAAAEAQGEKAAE